MSPCSMLMEGTLITVQFSYCLYEGLSEATLVLRHGAVLGFFLSNTSSLRKEKDQ